MFVWRDQNAGRAEAGTDKRFTNAKQTYING